jgi:putative Mn2+ efflux pump MntP
LIWFDLLGVALGLAMDAFAVSIAAGMTVAPVTLRQTFRLAFHFGLFQFMMPILGWLAGKELLVHVSAYDHWAAFGLLAFVGGRMLWEARQTKRPETAGDPTRGLMLVTLSLATSIDALAVGMSMALAGISIWLPCVVIGVVAAALTAVGITFGSRFGPRLGRWAEAAGGCVLILIGLRILVEHLSGW